MKIVDDIESWKEVGLKPFKVGLVLGGGGARGLAHVGVINVLERAGIPIDIIGGSSMGALLGGIYAQNPNAELLDKKVREFIKGPRFHRLGINNFKQKTEKDPYDVIRQLAHQVKRQLTINLAANRLALLKPERLGLVVKTLLEDTLIENCKIPFVCIATDLKNGNAIVFNSGRIRPAIEGSSAIPGFIPPVHYNGHVLIDGSVSNNFPIEPVRQMGASVVISVDASLDFEEDIAVDNVIDLVIRSAQISVRHLDGYLKRQSDMIISPPIGDVHWSEFNRVDELIQRGEQSAEEVLPKINKMLTRKKLFFLRKQ